MSKCDNWEKRKKVLEENGWHAVLVHNYECPTIWAKGEKHVDESEIKSMSLAGFYDFIGRYSTKSDTDAINHPSYYTDGKIEVSDFIADKDLNFFRGNVVKYICRAGKKNSSKEIEDLKKAEWYLNREIDRLEAAHV
jgi:non-ribosomal peptide synthetase component E (peptide arylation enzyme)